LSTPIYCCFHSRPESQPPPPSVREAMLDLVAPQCFTQRDRSQTSWLAPASRPYRPRYVELNDLAPVPTLTVLTADSSKVLPFREVSSAISVGFENDCLLHLASPCSTKHHVSSQSRADLRTESRSRHSTIARATVPPLPGQHVLQQGQSFI
jgi:hypothetical protein